MNCFNCKKPTNNPKFCNRSCSAIWTNKNYNKSKKAKVRQCKKCCDNYTTTNGHRSTKYCPKCSELWKTGRTFKNTTLEEVRNSLAVKDKHPSWIHSRVRANNKSWNKHLTKLSCQRCNYSLHVELCHIKPISSFPDSTTVGEVNHPDNILVLCRNCHWEFDNEYLKIEDIPNRSLSF